MLNTNWLKDQCKMHNLSYRQSSLIHLRRWEHLLKNNLNNRSYYKNSFQKYKLNRLWQKCKLSIELGKPNKLDYLQMYQMDIQNSKLLNII
jgi:hypothetical protein